MNAYVKHMKAQRTPYENLRHPYENHMKTMKSLCETHENLRKPYENPWKSHVKHMKNCKNHMTTPTKIL